MMMYARHFAEITPAKSAVMLFKLGAILEGTYARTQAAKAPMAVGKRLHKSTIQLFAKARDLMRANS